MLVYWKTKACTAKWAWIFVLVVILFGCDQKQWNNPYSDDDPKANTLYTSFSERPKHLDPAKSYSSNEWAVINQIYEPPLQYHYLNRPYTLVPLVADNMPSIQYQNAEGMFVDKGASDGNTIAKTIYTITIKPGIYYQPHPSFVKKPNSQDTLYHHLTEDELEDIYSINDFLMKDTRELVSEDFVYQIKRLGDPTLNSPIFGLMSGYIVGLSDYSKNLSLEYEKLKTIGKVPFIDLRDYPLEGAKVIDKYTYQITINGLYPQLLYWLAMPFFAPMPWEAVKFYSQEGLIDQNVTLDWYPVGTGPYYLVENNPNFRMTLVKNPKFHHEKYPAEGEPDDFKNGLLDRANMPLPFVDEVKFILEKESIPYWNKFLQGYYDQSGISSDSFDQALQSASEGGGLTLTPSLENKNIHLTTSVEPSTFYWGFNMLDEKVGGYSEKNRKLRQAISMVMDIEEYIEIFLNGRGVAAQSPLPPGIFGYQEGVEGMNSIVYQEEGAPSSIKRHSQIQAKALLKEAGYPEGIDPKTGKPLMLFLDAITDGGPDTKSQYDWLRKQFNKLNIVLVVRATQYNRFQEKMRTGNAQIFGWGWNADYPDPENFLFLLYGPNGKVKFGGENAANYYNPEFDSLFEQMKNSPNDVKRFNLIQAMIKIAQNDAPWIWGYHPKMYVLSHGWLAAMKPNVMSRNTLKYMALDPKERQLYRDKWNLPALWPIGLLVMLLCVISIPAILHYRNKEHQSPLLHPNDEENI
ncbi:MAG TPA: ABC transporter substrate-binding protein [Gammaproteobacteria bacterium]|nr:ABC transporter substrate-binding protein [Gammaproteobacteria bacterium]